MDNKPNGNGGPHREFYNGRGYGFLNYHTEIIGGNDWLCQHYEKYPKGKMPEQRIEIVRSKK